ncbi:hypothetical protein ACWEO2_43185 [Nocardia sp. NPDC004278]
MKPAEKSGRFKVYTPTDEVAWGKLRELLAMTEEQRQRLWIEHREMYHAAAE